MRRQLRQFLTFGLVGGIATAGHYLVLVVLVEWARLDPLLATSIGAAAGAVIAYTLNRKWTFSARPAIAVSFAKFFAIAGIGLVLNGVLFSLIKSAGVHYLLAQGLATGLVLFMNYWASRVFVFRD